MEVEESQRCGFTCRGEGGRSIITSLLAGTATEKPVAFETNRLTKLYVRAMCGLVVAEPFQCPK
jgi:hypothetical protein